MSESYCGLCDSCQLGNPEFLEALAKVRNYVGQFPMYWWRHCFPGEEGFSLPEFFKGLEWLLHHSECLGCKEGGGLEDCPIRRCASLRGVAECGHCPEVEGCEHYHIIIQGYPGQRIYLHRYSLPIKL